MQTMMRMSKRMAIAAAVTALFAGCSMGNPFMARPDAGGKPVVWNCAMIQMSSPPKYACPDGKTYTAFQLRDFRQNAENRQANTVAVK